MPLVILQHQTGRGLQDLAEKLAIELPSIVAKNLTLGERERHDGQVAPEDIMVWCRESKRADQNGKSLEIIIIAHDFPERKVNLEERKEAIIQGIRYFLADYGRKYIPGAVWVLLIPTAFGEFNV